MDGSGRWKGKKIKVALLRGDGRVGERWSWPGERGNYNGSGLGKEQSG